MNTFSVYREGSKTHMLVLFLDFLEESLID